MMESGNPGEQPPSVPGAGDILGDSSVLGWRQPKGEPRQELLPQNAKNDYAGEGDLETAARTFVLEVGSIETAEQAVESLRSSPAAFFVKRIGTADDALRLLRQIHDRSGVDVPTKGTTSGGQ